MDTISPTVQNDMSTTVTWSKSKPDVEFQYGGRFCELMLKHVIPEPHATLQGAVTWRNQCHDRAILQGVRIPSAILKIVIRHISFIFLFLMQFRLRRAAAFASSPIHFFDAVCVLACSASDECSQSTF